MLRLQKTSASAMKNASLVAASTCFLMMIGTTSAKAATLIFNTSDSPFKPGIDSQGWWSNVNSNSYYNSSGNYYVGESPNGSGYRNFFTFNLAALPQTETVFSAVLKLFRHESSSGGTYKLFDVLTPAATLNNQNGINHSIYNDLGSGNSYGTFFVYPSASDSQGVFSFALNSLAVSDINSAKGDFFSIGGSFQAFQSGYYGYLFGNSSSYGIQSLVVETVPISPPTPVPTPALLPGLIGLGVSALRRRKQLDAVAVSD